MTASVFHLVLSTHPTNPAIPTHLVTQGEFDDWLVGSRSAVLAEHGVSVGILGQRGVSLAMDIGNSLVRHQCLGSRRDYRRRRHFQVHFEEQIDMLVVGSRRCMAPAVCFLDEMTVIPYPHHMFVL